MCALTRTEHRATATFALRATRAAGAAARASDVTPAQGGWEEERWTLNTTPGTALRRKQKQKPTGPNNGGAGAAVCAMALKSTNGRQKHHTQTGLHVRCKSALENPGMREAPGGAGAGNRPRESERRKERRSGARGRGCGAAGCWVL
jgi:hypothetical protein